MSKRNRKQQASMSFLTSLGLSANNLRTKKGRTALTAFAGSIGIIGIALILALSNGVNAYIQSIEEDTLAEYPLQITSSAFDLTAMMGTMMPTTEETNDEDTEIAVTEVLNSLFSSVNSNDLTSLKNHLESGQTDVYDHVRAIEYQYDSTLEVYLQDGEETHKVNPVQTMSFSSGSSMTGMFSASGMSSFYKMPENKELYEDSYELKAGHWPEDYNEAILVLQADGSTTDFTTYTLGLRDYEELEEMMKQYQSGESVEPETAVSSYKYDDVLGTTYKVVCPADYYVYDEEYEIWVDKSENQDHLDSVLEKGIDLTIVGVVQPTEASMSGTLMPGINYTGDLIYHMAELAEDSDVVKAQMNNPKTNIFTAEAFGDDADGFDMASMFSMDTDALSNAFNFGSLDSMDLSSIDFGSTDFSSMDFSSMDMSQMTLGTMDLSGLDLSQIDLSQMDLSDLDFGSMDFSDAIDLSSVDLSAVMSSIDLSKLQADLSNLDLEELMKDVSVDLSAENLQSLATGIIEGYETWIANNGGASYSNLINDYTAYLNSSEASAILSAFLNEKLDGATITVSREGLEAAIRAALPTSDDEEVDPSKIAAAVSEYLQDNVSITSTITASDLSALANSLSSGYAAYAAANGLTTASDVTDGFIKYLNSDTAQTIITEGISKMVDVSAVQEKLTEAVGSYIQEAVMSVLGAYSDAIEKALTEQMSTLFGGMMTQATKTYATALESMMTAVMAEMSTQITSQMGNMIAAMVNTMMTEVTSQLSTAIGSMMEGMMQGLSSGLADAFAFDADSFAEAMQFDMDADTLTDMLLSMSNYAGADYESNLTKLGYVNFEKPIEIDIYPIDYDHKQEVLAVLDGYNEEMEKAGEKEKVITYTDFSAAMMSSVNTIVNVVTYVLIAFVAVSLIVSSIMISIITQISVMERTKEIGVLRAMGASKGNVSQVFIAETFIIGSLSGLLGVSVTRLLLIPINFILHAVIGDASVNAVLPLTSAIILVLISIGITVLSGLAPALSAAKKDPVTALRTE